VLVETAKRRLGTALHRVFKAALTDLCRAVVRGLRPEDTEDITVKAPTTF